MSHWKIGVKILCVVLKRGSIFYGSQTGVKILCSKSWEGQNSMKAKIWGSKFYFFSWNPWSKFYVPWKGGSKFYIFSQCLEKGGSKPQTLPTNFTEGVPPPPPPPPPRGHFPGATILSSESRVRNWNQHKIPGIVWIKRSISVKFGGHKFRQDAENKVPNRGVYLLTPPLDYTWPSNMNRVPTHSGKLREMAFPWKIREISGNLPSSSGNFRKQQNLREISGNFGYGRFKCYFWEML